MKRASIHSPLSMNLRLSTDIAWLLVVATALATPRASAADSPAKVQFNRDIRPIMSDVCFKCHGPGKQLGGMRLDLREAALKPAESGDAPIVPGDSGKSELIRRISSTDEGEQMPPPSAHKTLTQSQKDLLKRWVDEGAPYQKHWSFETPVKADVPHTEGTSFRVNNPIDAFIAARLQAEGLTMSSEADRETLIRRVSFALTGLPPTLGEIDTFLGDSAPDAYEKMVDRYLASERFGEEMARHWLDVARYADTHGLHLDNERQIWAYRDWVIRAFNQGKPFDQFTVEQLAGDLLPGAKQEQLVATGFLRCNVTTGEGGSIDDEWIYRNAVDRTTTTAETWLGLTAGCCVCHDHKYDPIPTKEYYSLYAFFHSSADPPLDGNTLLTAPSIKLATPDQEKQLAEFDAKIAAKRQQLKDAVSALAYSDPAAKQPPPEAETFEQVWFDDELPAGAKIAASPGQPTMYITAEQGPVASGKRAVKRTDAGLAQDVVDSMPPSEIPPDGKLFAYVRLESKDMPKAIMLQYFKGGWLHRAVWGDYNVIDWGRVNTTERVLIGPLPACDEWVRLEFEAAKLGLQPGDAVTGFALTQFGGTVYWDKVGVSGRSDPAADPRRSMLAWWKQQTGKDTQGVPAELNAALKAGPDKRPSAEVEKQLRDWYLENVCADTRKTVEPLRSELAAIEKQRSDLDQSIPSTFVFRDLPAPRESFTMVRGQYNKPGEKVEPNTFSILPPLNRHDPNGRANRLDLARWLVASENPLTARVTVNRFWQQVYGVGIVKTSYDFGTQGEQPSHPELLDWLAVWFRENGWNVKQLVRLMVTSAAFRQTAVAPQEIWKRDPENRLLAHGPRIRLDAEQLRDNALFVSGLLNFQMGGPGVRPYQPPNIWEPVGFVGSNTRDYKQDHGPSLYRRSIYTFFKRTAPPPFMATFDAPNREGFCTRRERSNTPLQALQLMNDVQHYEAARKLAERLLAEGGSTPKDRIEYGYRLVLARRPSADETAIVSNLLQVELTRYAQNTEAAKQAVGNGESAPSPGSAEPELAAYTMACNLLLNLDETIERN